MAEHEASLQTMDAESKEMEAVMSKEAGKAEHLRLERQRQKEQGRDEETNLRMSLFYVEY
jgi:hypothetical protein